MNPRISPEVHRVQLPSGGLGHGISTASVSRFRALWSCRWSRTKLADSALKMTLAGCCSGLPKRFRTTCPSESSRRCASSILIWQRHKFSRSTNPDVSCGSQLSKTPNHSFIALFEMPTGGGNCSAGDENPSDKERNLPFSMIKAP